MAVFSELRFTCLALDARIVADIQRTVIDSKMASLRSATR